MTVNLNMEPTFIVETMGLQWTSELSFQENVPILMKRFKKERGLKPFKVIIYLTELVINIAILPTNYNLNRNNVTYNSTF